MNSVKILHAVRSAITATAELLVIFQQDGSPAHRARDAISFLQQETANFKPVGESYICTQ